MSDQPVMVVSEMDCTSTKENDQPSSASSISSGLVDDADGFSITNGNANDNGDANVTMETNAVTTNSQSPAVSAAAAAPDSTTSSTPPSGSSINAPMNEYNANDANATSNSIQDSTANSTIASDTTVEDAATSIFSSELNPPVIEDPEDILSATRSITSRLLSLRVSPPGTTASLSESEIKNLCKWSRPIFLQQAMLLELEAPLKICGDVHGQFTDLLRLFEYGGFPPNSNYLFLGDYVDRGKQSLETICLLLCYKIQFPESFFILRGNHESAGINRIYGFYDECKRRYSIRLWKVFSDVFNCLPISAIVDEKILCMHGGLSPELNSFEQVRNLLRPCDVPDVGLMCDLLWSDPDTSVNGWAENDRGVSFVFGADIVSEFLEKHDLDLLVRAHQVVEDGYEFFAGRRLVTLFSAPNYCGEFDNAGGMISVNEELLCSFQILKPSTRSSRFAANANTPPNPSLAKISKPFS